MATNETSPAKKKTYCVWADYVRRMYQHVEAGTPKEAFDMAKGQPESWQPCQPHDRNVYRLSDDVQETDTEEFIAVNGSLHCKSCGSEIVETVNGSNFREGECGACEYQRYASQPDLLDACVLARERSSSDCRLRMRGRFFSNGTSNASRRGARRSCGTSYWTR